MEDKIQNITNILNNLMDVLGNDKAIPTRIKTSPQFQAIRKELKELNEKN